MRIPTRAEIRRAILGSGRIDLGEPGAADLLEQEVVGFDIWFRSEVAAHLDLGHGLTPRKLLSQVAWQSPNMREKVEKDIITTLEDRKVVKLSGKGAYLAAGAFAMQFAVRRHWNPVYIHAGTLLAEEIEEESLGSKSLLLLQTSPDPTAGNIFAEAQAKIVAFFEHHQGRTLIVSDGSIGILGRLIEEIKKPTLRVGVNFA